MLRSRQSILWSVVVISSALALLNHGALENGWYWKFYWFDIMMHFLGGMVVALVLVWLIRLFNVSFNRWQLIAVLLSGTIVVGILWEVFEYVIGFYPATRSLYIKDTSMDLVMDILGAGLVSFTLSPNRFTKGALDTSETYSN